MKFRNLLIVNSVVFLAFAFGFIVIPSMLLTLFGVSPESSTVVAVQLYGGLLVAVGLLCWLSRDNADVAVLRAMQLSLMIAYVINTIVHIRATMAGSLNALGWTAVLIYLLLTVGYAYFYVTSSGETYAAQSDTQS